MPPTRKRRDGRGADQHPAHSVSTGGETDLRVRLSGLSEKTHGLGEIAASCGRVKSMGYKSESRFEPVWVGLSDFQTVSGDLENP
jgi:hypothetical protein